MGEHLLALFTKLDRSRNNFLLFSLKNRPDPCPAGQKESDLYNNSTVFIKFKYLLVYFIFFNCILLRCMGTWYKKQKLLLIHIEALIYHI